MKLMLVILNGTLPHNQNDCAVTCILVLVNVFTTRSFEFTQKYQYSPNNLITDFMKLSNQMFLFINCSL